MVKNVLRSLFLSVMLLISGISVYAQGMTANITVEDQFVYNGTVTVDSVFSEGDNGFVVIHADNGNGEPGQVIGYRSVNQGDNSQVVVSIDVANSTPTLFAMLHADSGEEGVYEFGSVEDADAPVVVDDAVIMQSFAVEVMAVTDQLINEEVATFTANTIVTQVNGWLVVHADDGTGEPGAVLGQAFVPAGTSNGVTVPLEGDVTHVLYPMMHTDTGEAEAYEFGGVEGADTPVNIGGRTAVTSILTVPTIRVHDQIVIGSDTMAASGDAVTTVHANSVLSDGPGWLVVHAADENGNPANVIGYSAVQNGFNSNVAVELTTADITPVIFPMLHVDTGEDGVYEFGEVEGADGPVMIDGQIVVVPVNVAPSITYTGTLNGNVLVVGSVLVDAPGWLVIHADDGNSAPGEVIGYSAVVPGLNTNVSVDLDEGKMTPTLFPMLHYDDNEVFVYEFGTVEGADGPVILNGRPVVAPLNPMVIE